MKLYITFILLFLGIGIKCIATDLLPFVVTYNKDDYNASSKNWSIALNSEGIIYVGNHEGLLEGDGQTWRLYRLPAGGIVRSVAVDKNNRIYTGSFEEFGFWEADSTGQLLYVSLSDKLQDFTLHNEQIWKIIIRDNIVYFQAFKNVFVYKDNKVKVITPEKNIVFLLEARNRLITQSVDGGLFELVNGKFEKVKNSEILGKADLKVVLPFGKNSFLLGSGNKGLFIWEKGNFKIWDCEAQQVLKDKQINHGVFFNGSYYIGTITDGVFIVNSEGRIISHLNTASSLLNNTILGMSFDSLGNLWLTHDKGLSFVQFNFPYHPFISPNNKIGAVQTAAYFKGILYLGTNQGVYFAPLPNLDFSKIKLTDFQFLEGSQGHVWELKEMDGQLLCGHNKGTFRIDNNKLELISSVSGGFSIKKLSENRLVQSTYTNFVIYQLKNNKWEYQQKINDFIEPIRYVETDFRGNLWGSHNLKGFYKLKVSSDFSKITSWKYFGKKQGFAIESKAHVFKLDNRIVFTSGNGIYTYDDIRDSVINYTELNAKLGQFANAEKIVAAQNNLYWFIQNTGVGLFKINENNVTLIMQLQLNRPGYHLVDTNPNIVPLSENLHLVCLEDGFVVVDIDNKSMINNLNPIIFRRVFDNNRNKRLPLSNQTIIPKIPYRNNSLSFAFSPVQFPGSGIRFSVKLDGLNANWSALNYNSTKAYSRLPWGKYTFRVKGVNEFGKEIPEANYAFEINAPWYASNFAYLFYVILAVAFFIVFPVTTNRYFKKQQENHKKKQEKIYREKQKEQQMLAEQKIVKLRNQNLQKELENKSKELANNTMIIIRRNETLTEIKNEFEKQKEILGSRFPNKNYEKIINMINRNLSNEEEWKVFEENFDHAHNNFFKRLKKVYPSLTPGDLRLCAYLHLNLTSKEIAPLLNISIRGVEIHRYRLRKKLELGSDENLVEFIMQF